MKLRFAGGTAKVLPLLVAGSLALAPRSEADALDHWNWLNPVPTGENIADLEYGNGQFVAVGSAGVILSSPDGRTWAQAYSPVVTGLSAVTFADGKFVAVGQGGRIVRSAGSEWFECHSGTVQSLTSVAYGNGWFVAVGNGGTVTRSSDGITWTLQSSGTTKGLTGVTHGNGMFVAVGGDTYARMSTDGASWQPYLIRTAYQDSYITGITRAFDRFYATLHDGPPSSGWHSFISTNGVNWVPQTNFFGAYTLSEAVSNGEKTLATFQNDGQEVGSLIASTNGTDWSYVTVSPNEVVHAIAHGNGVFVTAGPKGLLSRSTDGQTWETTRRGDVDMELAVGVQGSGRYVFVGSTILTSSNLVTFSRTNGLGAGVPIPLAFLCAAHGEGVFVAGGSGGRIVRSTNGVDWAVATSGTTTRIRGTAYGAGRFVAVGEGGMIRTSVDGKVWQGATSGIASHLLSVTFSGTQFVAVGAGGTVLTSPTGINWELRDAGVDSVLLSVIYANGDFLAVGYDSTNGNNPAAVIRSVDGVTWTKINTGLAVPLQWVAYGGGLFLAATGTGAGSAGSVGIYESADGESWLRRDTGSTPLIGGVAFLDNSFILLGQNGTILQSDRLGEVYLKMGEATSKNSREIVITGGEMGQAYQLQECVDFTLSSWANRTSFVQTRYVSRMTVPNSGTGKSFFRVTKVGLP